MTQDHNYSENNSHNTDISVDHLHEEGGKKNTALSLAFWMNVLFSIIELIGGLLTNSTAIIADAFHDSMDAIAIGIAILLERFSNKKRTSSFSYGYKRFSMLSALGLSVFLLIGVTGMVISAYKSFLEPKEVNSLGMLGLAILGVMVNGFAFLKIKKSNDRPNEHSHNHSDSRNHNSRSIMLHLLEDVLGWLAVLIGAILIYFTGWSWIDGILTIGIAAYIGYNAGKNLLGIAKIMLQSVPENVDMGKLEKELTALNDIIKIHDIHVWSLDGNYNVGTLHAVIDKKNMDVQQMLHHQIVTLMKQHNVHHTTVQIEIADNDCGLEQC